MRKGKPVPGGSVNDEFDEPNLGDELFLERRKLSVLA
jgi:hypothetical protein